MGYAVTRVSLMALFIVSTDAGTSSRDLEAGDTTVHAHCLFSCRCAALNYGFLSVMISRTYLLQTCYPTFANVSGNRLVSLFGTAEGSVPDNNDDVEHLPMCLLGNYTPFSGKHVFESLGHF